MHYASSDITAFMNPACPKGGHLRKLTNAAAVRKGQKPEFGDDRLVIDCPVCETSLAMKAKDSWSADPLEIPQTKSERLTSEALEKEGQKAQAEMALAFAAAAREAVRDRAAAGA